MDILGTRLAAEYPKEYPGKGIAVFASSDVRIHPQMDGPLAATATYLSVLGLAPSLGRWFNATEDTPGAAVVAVVGHEAWTRKFRADPSVIGRTIRIDGVPVTIVGVGPAGHRGTTNVFAER